MQFRFSSLLRAKGRILGTTITVLQVATVLMARGAAQVSSRPQANQQVNQQANQQVNQQVNQQARNIEAGSTGQAQSFRLPQSQHVTGAQYPAAPVGQRPYHEHRALIVPKGPIRPLQTISPPTPIHQINRQAPQNLQRPISVESPARELPAAFQLNPASKPGAPSASFLPYLGPAPPPAAVDVFTNTDFGSALSNDADGEEDSEASAANVVFFTGNWFAAFSSNGGATFQYINPTTVFPSADGGFCCDQAVIYMPQIDRFAWLIQYGTNTSGENRYRLAIASPSDLTKSAGTAWAYYDLTSAMFGLTKEWMDFPELAVGKNSLYIAANIFGTPSDAQHIVMRIPVSSLVSGGPGDYFIWKGNNNSNFALAQNSPSRLPETTQFWAAHISTSQIRVFSWAEGSKSPTHKDLDIGSWPFADHSSLTPGGVNWLAGLKTNMRAGNDGNNLWLAFPVGRDDPDFVKETKPPVVIPQPHIKIVRISLASITVVEEQYIWDTAAAYSFPTLAANSSRQIGIAFAWGGNSRSYANVALGVLNSPSGEAFDPYVVNVAFSSIGAPWWGDYINVREHYPDTRRFSAGVFSINKTSTSLGYKNNPHFVIFGQSVTEAPFRPR